MCLYFFILFTYYSIWVTRSNVSLKVCEHEHVCEHGRKDPSRAACCAHAVRTRTWFANTQMFANTNVFANTNMFLFQILICIFYRLRNIICKSYVAVLLVY